MIRRADPSDAEAIARLEAAGAHHPWSLNSVRSQLSLATVHAFVAGSPTLVAHLISSVVAEEAEILTLVVAPSARRRGLARALLAEATSDWQHAGVAQAYLEVRADNEPARLLYEVAGWTVCGKRPNYYGEGQHAVLYKLTQTANPSTKGGT